MIQASKQGNNDIVRDTDKCGDILISVVIIRVSEEGQITDRS